MTGSDRAECDNRNPPAQRLVETAYEELDVEHFRCGGDTIAEPSERVHEPLFPTWGGGLRASAEEVVDPAWCEANKVAFDELVVQDEVHGDGLGFVGVERHSSDCGDGCVAEH